MNAPGVTQHGRGDPKSPALAQDQLSGDLLCPMCGEPLELQLHRTEDGAEYVGACAECMSLCEVDL